MIIIWNNFVNDIWSLIEIWWGFGFGFGVLDFWIWTFMPENFKNYYPYTRIIIDGTEIPIQNPSQPDAQKVSFNQKKWPHGDIIRSCFFVT